MIDEQDDRDGWFYNVSPDGFIPTSEGPIHVYDVPDIVEAWAKLKQDAERVAAIMDVAAAVHNAGYRSSFSENGEQR